MYSLMLNTVILDFLLLRHTPVCPIDQGENQEGGGKGGKRVEGREERERLVLTDLSVF